MYLQEDRCDTPRTEAMYILQSLERQNGFDFAKEVETAELFLRQRQTKNNIRNLTR